MDITKHLRTFLLTDSSIRAAVGTRISPAPPTQSATYPLITYQEISDVPDAKLKGPSSMARARIQIDAWVQSSGEAAYKEARRIGQLIRDLLDGRNITVLDDDVSPPEPRLMAFELDSSDDQFEPATNGGYRRRSIDVFVRYQTGKGAN